jgi:hypothetical protein
MCEVRLTDHVSEPTVLSETSSVNLVSHIVQNPKTKKRQYLFDGESSKSISVFCLKNFAAGPYYDARNPTKILYTVLISSMHTVFAVVILLP